MNNTAAASVTVSPASPTDEDLTSLFDEIAKRLPTADPYMEVNAVGGAVRQTFREFTASLSDERFFVGRRGVVINLEHTSDFDGKDFLLKNGKRIHVSRDLAKNARLTFHNFLFETMRNP